MYYEISAENRITNVSKHWDATAVSNHGFNCVAKKVWGRNLFDFISGFQTQSYVNALLFSVRSSGKPVSTTYRCDTDSVPRLVYMTVAPHDNGQLRVTHRDIPISVPAKTPSFEGRILRGQCCQCYALHMNEEWVGAGIGHDMFMAPNATGLCPSCRTLAVNAITATSQILRSALPR